MPTGLSAHHPHFELKDVSYLNYVQNKGQWDDRVLYRADVRGGSLFAERNALTWVFYPKDGLPNHHHHSPKEIEAVKDPVFHALQLRFSGSNPMHAVTHEDPQPFYHNYFLGKDPSRWASRVSLFKSVTHKDLYQNIDLKLSGRGNNTRYDFVVRPGGDPAEIQLTFEGQQRLFLRDGQLVLITSGGEVTQQAPYAYQTLKDGSTQQVACDYVVKGNTISFNIGNNYMRNLPLVIDPTLIFSTYTGSSADNWGMSATFDQSGNAYTAGVAFGLGYPLSLGAFQTFFMGPGTYPGGDITLSKFNGTGNTLLFSTYLGGTGVESPQSITVDGNDNLIVLGRSYSANFPVVAGCYDVSKSLGSDIIVTKFNSSGTALLGSTFIGGTADDGINITDGASLTSLKRNYADDARGAVHVDANNNIYVASCTNSGDFPTTPGCFQSSSGGMQDGCVFKFNPALTTLVYSSYLGGSSNDAAYNLALDALNGVYVTGGTESSNFPVTANALDVTYGGAIDGFVTHISPAGNAIQQSTFLGTSLYEQSYFVQIDYDNHVYLYGQCSGNYPITPGTYFNSNSGQFIHKLDSVLGATYFSTEFGTGSGAPDIVPSAFLVDNCKSIYISGWGGPMGGANNAQSTTTGMPITQNAFQSTTDGSDFYFASFKQNAALLQYATFFGGAISMEHVDGGTSCFDKSGVIYQAICASCGGNQDLPTTPGVWSPSNGSFNCNNGLVKYQMDLINTVAQANVSSNIIAGCAPFTASLVNTSTNALSYEWQFGNGATSTSTNPVYTYTAIGTFVIRLIASDSTTCNKTDTAFINITVKPPAEIPPQMTNTNVCRGQSVQLGISFAPASSYTWTPPGSLNSPSIQNPLASPLVTTIYTLALNDTVCSTSSSRTVQVNVHVNNTDVLSPALCSGDLITLKTTSTYVSYLWNTGATTREISGFLEGLYYVNTVDSNGCSGYDSARIYTRVPILPQTFDVCEGLYRQFLAPQGAAYQYTWTPASFLSNTGVYNPFVTPTVSTTYTLELAYGPCVSSNTFAIRFKPAPRTLIGTNGANLCLTDTVVLNTPYSASYSYTWSTGDHMPTTIVTSQGGYTVTVLDTNGCMGIDTLLLRNVPPYSTEPASVTICEGDRVRLHADSGYSYRWFPNYRIDKYTDQNPEAYPVSTTIYTLIISNGRCASSVNHTVFVNPAPFLQLSSTQEAILPGESVQLHAQWDTAGVWSPYQMISCYDCPDPIVDPLETTTYACYVVDRIGCTNTQTVLVEVIPTLYVPDCFTPNGDGVNDIFKPKHSGFEKVHLTVFNRWGQTIWSSEDKEAGWDGKFEGAICPDGYYAWLLYAKDSRLKVIERAGSVLLMK